VGCSSLPLIVSILTRPEGRVLRQPTRKGRQPVCFNPHPTRRSGATGSPCPSPDGEKVSILTRPEGRVLRPLLRRWSTIPACFNPHPTRRSGATNVSASTTQTNSSFQSSPDPKVGCYGRPGGGCGACSGFNPHPTRRSGATPGAGVQTNQIRGFNPHPTRRSGATRRAERRFLPCLFQSSPDPKVGCYARRKDSAPRDSCFNPHPTRRSGATQALRRLRVHGVVSILTRPEGRVLRGCPE